MQLHKANLPARRPWDLRTSSEAFRPVPQFSKLSGHSKHSKQMICSLRIRWTCFVTILLYFTFFHIYCHRRSRRYSSKGIAMHHPFDGSLFASQEAREFKRSFSRRCCPGVSILNGRAFNARSTCSKVIKSEAGPGV